MVTRDEFFDWLAAHGLDRNRVRNIEITHDGVRFGDGRRVLLKVTQYAHVDGRAFADRTRYDLVAEPQPPRRWWQRRVAPKFTTVLEPAIEVVWVPMQRLPLRARRRAS